MLAFGCLFSFNPSATFLRALPASSSRRHDPNSETETGLLNPTAAPPVKIGDYPKTATIDRENQCRIHGEAPSRLSIKERSSLLVLIDDTNSGIRPEATVAPRTANDCNAPDAGRSSRYGDVLKAADQLMSQVRLYFHPVVGRCRPAT